jgi:hypothetical protein
MNALQKQVGGNHYKNMAIQPAEYCQRNNLNHLESSVVKYVSRHRQKNGPEDIKKAIHCLELLLAIDYPDAKDEDILQKPATKDEAFESLKSEVNAKLPKGKSLAEFLNEEADKDNFGLEPNPINPDELKAPYNKSNKK